MRKIAIALVAAALLGPACAATGSPLGPSTDSNGSADPNAAVSAMSSSTAADLAMCADETNRYRASVGLRPLVRSAVLEDFATRAAAVDGVAHVAHNHFAGPMAPACRARKLKSCGGADSTCAAVIQRGLAQMWQVGPGGEHYDIMAGAFSEIGVRRCGQRRRSHGYAGFPLTGNIFHYRYASA